MCGIIGYIDKQGKGDRPVGATLFSMLKALSCRGPDSTGVALYGPRQAFWILQIKLPEQGDPSQAEHALMEVIAQQGVVARHKKIGAYLRLEVKSSENPVDLERHLIQRVPGAEIVSLGNHLEIVKQVGSPEQLEKTYEISKKTGSHGIGHTRLSTESKVDLSHSQPFWAHGVPDLATVHNGHITNYHRLRRQYEQKGYRFYTENDSEVIGIYLRDRMAAGMPLADALRSSLDDFDGSFSYLAANGDMLAFVKDRYGFKPLVVAETKNFVAIATEEIALRRAFGNDFVAREPAPGTMKVWQVDQEIAKIVA